MKSQTKKDLSAALLTAIAATMLVPFTLGGAAGALAQDIIPESSSLVAAADIQPPTDVENVVATSGNGQVKLTWNVATDDSGIVKGYRIYYGTSPVTSAGDEYTVGPIDVGNKITYTVTGLTNGTTYYFVLTAYDDANNESENYSAAVNATPAHAAADTEAPKVISAEASNKNMVKVVFSEPVVLPETDPDLAFTVKNDTTSIGLAVTGAEMYQDDNTGKTVVLMTATQQAGATYNLTAGIQVKDESGNTIVSGTSDTALFTGTDIEPAPIVTQESHETATADTEGPQLTDVMASDETHVMVVFNEPVILSADPTTAFYITEGEDTENSLDIVSATLSSDKKTATLMTKPQQDMLYNLIVLDAKDEAGNDIDVANNATTFQGQGSAAPVITQETVQTEETQTTQVTQSDDTIAPEDVTNFLAQMLKQMVVTLTWTGSLNSVGDLANYVLYKSTDGVTYGEGVLLDATATSFDVTGLVPGMKYFFKLTARDTTGNESKGMISMFQLPSTGPELLFLLGASMGAGKFLKRKKKGLKK